MHLARLAATADADGLSGLVWGAACGASSPRSGRSSPTPRTGRHELRTPLNAILGFAQLMKMDDLSQEHDESVGRIVVAGKHLLTLINEVLDIASLQAGRMSLSVEPVSVAEVVSASLSLISPLVQQRDLVLDSSLPDETVYVSADPQRLKQVLLNLLSNAAKYNSVAGTITVTGIEQDGTYRIEVTDTGPGIPRDKLARIFVPFDRLGAEADSIEGTGLGLPLSKELVDAMGGRLGVNSAPGAGTTFFVELPVAEDATPDPVAGLDELGDHDGPATRGTVLYIEDKPPNTEVMRRLLARRPGVTLLAAENGEAGIGSAVEQAPDLILLDLHLPDMDGIDVLCELRADPRCASIPVVVVSADATRSQRDRAFAAGPRATSLSPSRRPTCWSSSTRTSPRKGQSNRWGDGYHLVP